MNSFYRKAYLFNFFQASVTVTGTGKSNIHKQPAFAQYVSAACPACIFGIWPFHIICSSLTYPYRILHLLMYSYMFLACSYIFLYFHQFFLHFQRPIIFRCPAHRGSYKCRLVILLYLTLPQVFHEWSDSQLVLSDRRREEPGQKTTPEHVRAHCPCAARGARPSVYLSIFFFLRKH